MPKDSWKWLFTWEGRVQRGPYFLAGTTLTVLKYAIDYLVAAQFGETWRIWNYFFPSLDVSLSKLGNRQPELYAILWAIAILSGVMQPHCAFLDSQTSSNRLQFA